MKGWGRLVAVLTLFIGALSAFVITNDAHADANSGGSFSIYATQEICGYYENNLTGCNSSTAKTAEINLSDSGEYSIGNYSGADRDKMEMRIDGKQLVLVPSCAAFNNNCGREITINLGDNINDAYSAVNAALNGETWVLINQSVGSSFYNDTQYRFSAEDVTDPTKVPAPSGEAGGASTEVKATCLNSGDMNTLGWILCPAMTLMGDAANGLYNDAVKPALQVEPKLFTDGNGGAEQAWGVFRNIANVVLIIFLLLIIFSQITGVGIDNYGIKKALPKVIVAAILMNLSFFLCVIMIDLSNILGNSLQALFNGLPVGTPPTTLSGVDISEVAAGFGTTVLTGATLAAALVGGIWAAGGGVAVAVGLLVAVIGVVVSIFFLFIILSVRQAAIIVLAVISPIAIICYMLPNTKNWFDKWWKFFGSLLLVYPIAGMLVGGGNFVSKLMLVIGGSEGGFFWAFTAMLASIVPIFFIPTVLRNSLNAAGQLGAKISGMGQRVGSRLSGGADRAIRGSNTYRNYQNYRDSNRQRRWARGMSAITDRLDGTRIGNTGLMKQMRTNAQRVETGHEAQEIKNWVDQIDTYDYSGTVNALNEALASGDDERIRGALIAAEKKGAYDEIFAALDQDVSSNSKITGQLASSNNKLLSEYGKATGQGYRGSLADWAQDTSDANGAKQVFGGMGAAALDGMSKKDLKYMVGSGGSGVFSTDALRNGASQAVNDSDSQSYIQDMLKQQKANGTQTGSMRTSELANLNKSTFDALDASIYQAAVAELRANPTSSANQQVLNSMDQDVKSALGL